MGEVVSLHDEVKIMKGLKDDTVELIHSTTLVVAIKELVSAWEIIDLNLSVQVRFTGIQPVWDFAALSDLERIRRELNVYYKYEFDPVIRLEKYSTRIGYLFRMIDLRLQNRAG